MTPGAATLSVLYLGGTGTISAACVRASVAAGHDVTVVTRGGDAKGRGLPAGVTPLVADVTDPDALREALGDRSFDAVVDFLSFDAAGADRRVDVFAGRTRQFVAISSASIYRKPALQTPITESTLRANPFLAYARDKIAMEDAFLLHHATSGFPVVIVRPSHTYDEASPPLAGDWTVVDRIARGEEVVVPGDGTSLWTLTHADDFAVGLVGILGDERATGEALHITSDDVMTWDRINHLVADALGVEARIVHVPAEQFPVVEPDWGWSELVVGDLSHSAVFDTTRIRRLVPAFQPRIPFHLAVRGIVAFRAAHPDLTRPDADTDRRIARLVAAKHAADAAYRDAGAAGAASAAPATAPAASATAEGGAGA